MEIEIWNDNGDLERVAMKKSKYQSLSLDLLECYQQAEPPFERSKKTKNPEYFRLKKEGRFVGFKRVVTEFMPAGHSSWQLEPIEHNPEETQKLSEPAMGIGAMKRERITC